VFLHCGDALAHVYINRAVMQCGQPLCKLHATHLLHQCNDQLLCVAVSEAKGMLAKMQHQAAAAAMQSAAMQCAAVNWLLRHQ
jgi:hypothetical protein